MNFNGATNSILKDDHKIHPFKKIAMAHKDDTNEYVDLKNYQDSSINDSNYSLYKDNFSDDNSLSVRSNTDIDVNATSNGDIASSAVTSELNFKKPSVSNRHDRKRTKSMDLSHLYRKDEDSDSEFTATNEFIASASHEILQQQLDENPSALTPRLETIEMYRQNLKKSKDPIALFEFAQYMLQTALSMKSSDGAISNNGMNLQFNAEDGIDCMELRKQFLKESHHYLKKLASKGYVDAQYLLGDAYASGAFGKVDNKESFNQFRAAAKHGHVESAYRASYCLENGLGTTRDSKKSIDFLKFAATRNHQSSMFKLGLYSFYGRMGISDDITTKQNGIKWLSRAAARANKLTAAAPYELAKIYQRGFLDLIIPDEKYAVELYIQAASLGHTTSAVLLGQLYETGNSSIKQDVSLSVHYYTQAAMNGNPIGMMGLCAWYILGAEPAFAKDESEAYEWAYKAANCGYPKAQFTLGYFLEKGKGCEKDINNAWKWYEVAAKNNDPRAKRKLESRDQSTSSAQDVSLNERPHHERSRSTNTVNLFKSTTKELFNNLDSDEDKFTASVDEIVGSLSTPMEMNQDTYTSSPVKMNPSRSIPVDTLTSNNSTSSQNYFTNDIGNNSPRKQSSTTNIPVNSKSKFNTTSFSKKPISKSSNYGDVTKKKKNCLIM
ncbi:hypothetical protein TPHA_0A00930 [Tetrapisispora phaffii CBS 4417]|uniref:Protein SKT5 n=1 Tax=Tetrapisispora phaffii (strain ATCC 24235 / CBS 4417 / NBRC 1672 / NRRL Y-8282 / UCD 70-5) TaxID=1071381 RepID=G8BMQ0_TETPH|nr:hypothetical protein TPHA_0A00930 [Tetrapisispora phaffii CBS 4417]CCE61178.1 hypothetical protein TPHA_0A00930 [Tetrapisispora phaffii CBS 4417]